jgi:hypothetical protein
VAVVVGLEVAVGLLVSPRPAGDVLRPEKKYVYAETPITATTARPPAIATIRFLFISRK